MWIELVLMGYVMVAVAAALAPVEPVVFVLCMWFGWELYKRQWVALVAHEFGNGSGLGSSRYEVIV